jgi:hypothetical protein
MENRRDFIKKITAAALVSTLPYYLKSNVLATPPQQKIWGALMHLSFNSFPHILVAGSSRIISASVTNRKLRLHL